MKSLGFPSSLTALQIMGDRLYVWTAHRGYLLNRYPETKWDYLRFWWRMWVGEIQHTVLVVLNGE